MPALNPLHTVPPPLGQSRQQSLGQGSQSRTSPRCWWEVAGRCEPWCQPVALASSSQWTVLFKHKFKDKLFKDKLVQMPRPPLHSTEPQRGDGVAGDSRAAVELGRWQGQAELAEQALVRDTASLRQDLTKGATCLEFCFEKITPAEVRTD